MSLSSRKLRVYSSVSLFRAFFIQTVALLTHAIQCLSVWAPAWASDELDWHSVNLWMWGDDYDMNIMNPFTVLKER